MLRSGSEDRAAVREPPRPSGPPPPPDQWVRVPAAPRSSATRPQRAENRSSPVRRARALPPEVAAEIRAAAATARRAEDLVGRAEQAVAAFEADRFEESLRLARSVLSLVPGLAPLMEVAGLAAYRLGRWRDAAKQLTAYRDLTGATDVVPPLMDCYRALGRTAVVARLWTELRRAPAEADVVSEARIVGAGALADSGDLAGAISLLVAGSPPKSLRNPAERHLRRWYALGDLYERAGDVPRARELFGRVARVDPDAYDVHARLESLGRGRPAPRRRRPAAGRTRRAPGGEQAL